MLDNGVATALSLGEKLKTYRTKRRLSLAELAARSGISKSLISQIERSVVNPSVATIRCLAWALEIPVFLLFLEDNQHSDLIRHDQRRRLYLPGSNVERQLLTPEHRQRFVMLTMDLPPGEPTAPELTQHTGEECVYVRSGGLTVQLGDREIGLAAGDSLYFDALVPHRFINRGEDAAEVICAIVPAIDG